MAGLGQPKGYIPWNAGKKGTYRYVEYHIKPNGEVWAMRKKRCTLLKGYLDKKGYRRYTIHGKEIEGHLLVAKEHLPAKPGPDYQIDHINRVRHDNRVENLRWVTRKENCDNRIFGGTLEQAIAFVKAHGYTVEII